VLELKQLALAVAQQEGWFDEVNVDKPSIPHRRNNPGNLRWAPARFKQAAIRYETGGIYYVHFLSWFWGGSALLNDLRAKLLRGVSLRTAINIYCPVGDGANDPKIYVRNLCKWLGLDLKRADEKMSELFSDPGRIVGPWKDFPPPGPPRPFSKSSPSPS
jgi:hypothetical protein